MAVRVRTFGEGDDVAALTRLLHAAYARLGAMGFNYTAVDQTDDVTRDRAFWVHACRVPTPVPSSPA